MLKGSSDYSLHIHSLFSLSPSVAQETALAEIVLFGKILLAAVAADTAATPCADFLIVKSHMLSPLFSRHGEGDCEDIDHTEILLLLLLLLLADRT